ncbi:MAG: DMT family transporter [Thioalkalispiraceae bacterium]|jgi:drug/metabolite transporter (DMT)-like permease
MKALILLIVSGILTAGVFITGKQAGSEQLSPLLLLFWQTSGGALVVWATSWRSRSFPVWNGIHLRYYLIGGMLGISIPYVLAFIVLQVLQVGTVGLLTALSPVITYAIARLLGNERGHPLRLLGLIIGLCGVTVLVVSRGTVSFSGDWHYLLLALAIPVTLAISNIYRSRFWPAGSAALTLVIGMLTVQSVCLFFVNLALGNFHDEILVNQDTGVLLTILGLMAGSSYFTSFKLLKIGGPVYMSQMGYVITAATLLFGIVIWGEHYDRTEFMSMGLIMLGVLLTTLSQGIFQIKQSRPVVHGR